MIRSTLALINSCLLPVSLAAVAVVEEEDEVEDEAEDEEEGGVGSVRRVGAGLGRGGEGGASGGEGGVLEGEGGEEGSHRVDGGRRGVGVGLGEGEGGDGSS